MWVRAQIKLRSRENPKTETVKEDKTTLINVTYTLEASTSLIQKVV